MEDGFRLYSDLSHLLHRNEMSWPDILLVVDALEVSIPICIKLF